MDLFYYCYKLRNNLLYGFNYSDITVEGSLETSFSGKLDCFDSESLSSIDSSLDSAAL